MVMKYNLYLILRPCKILNVIGRNGFESKEILLILPDQGKILHQGIPKVKMARSCKKRGFRLFSVVC